jgi:hypothetical protein
MVKMGAKMGEPRWEHDGSTWGHHESTMRVLWNPGLRSGSHYGSHYGSHGGSTWEYMGAPWEHMGAPWEHMGAPWEHMGAPWEHMRVPWDPGLHDGSHNGNWHGVSCG